MLKFVISFKLSQTNGLTFFFVWEVLVVIISLEQSVFQYSKISTIMKQQNSKKNKRLYIRKYYNYLR